MTSAQSVYLSVSTKCLFLVTYGFIARQQFSFITVTKCNVLLCRVDQHYISCSHDDDAYKCVSDEWNRYNYDTRGANTWTNHNCLSVHCDQSVTSRCPLLLSLLLPFHPDLYVLWQRQSDRCLGVRQPTSQSSNTCRSWDSQVQGSSTAQRQCVSRTTCSAQGLHQERTTHWDFGGFTNQRESWSRLQDDRYVHRLPVWQDKVQHQVSYVFITDWNEINLK